MNNEDKLSFKIIFSLITTMFIIMGLFIFWFTMELIIQDSNGETIITFEQCKLYNGQIMVDELCERKIKCLNTGFFFKTCEELRNDG